MHCIMDKHVRCLIAASKTFMTSINLKKISKQLLEIRGKVKISSNYKVIDYVLIKEPLVEAFVVPRHRLEM